MVQVKGLRALEGKEEHTVSVYRTSDREIIVFSEWRKENKYKRERAMWLNVCCSFRTSASEGFDSLYSHTHAQGLIGGELHLRRNLTSLQVDIPRGFKTLNMSFYWFLQDSPAPSGPIAVWGHGNRTANTLEMFATREAEKVLSP